MNSTFTLMNPYSSDGIVETVKGDYSFPLYLKNNVTISSLFEYKVYAEHELTPKQIKVNKIPDNYRIVTMKDFTLDGVESVVLFEETGETS